MNLSSRSRPGLLIGLAVIGGVLAWSVETWLVSSGRAVMAPPLTMPLTLVVLALLLVWLAWPIRAYTRRLWRERREADSRPHAVRQGHDGADSGHRSRGQTSATGSQRGRRVDPQYAYRVLAFARAAILASALMLGVALGVLAFALTRTVPPEQAVWDAGFSVFGAIVLLVVGLLAEAWCRIPPGGEEPAASQDPVAA